MADLAERITSVVDAALRDRAEEISRLVRQLVADRLDALTRELVAEELHARTGNGDGRAAPAPEPTPEPEPAPERAVAPAPSAQPPAVVPTTTAPPRICRECGERPAADGRSVCETCRSRRRRLARDRTATPMPDHQDEGHDETPAPEETPAATAAAALVAPVDPAPARSRRPRVRQPHRRTWISAEERDVLDANREVIAAAPTRTETDQDGRSWVVRTLPPMFVAPLPVR